MANFIASGALAGWKRASTDHGVVVTVQVATSPEQYRARQFDQVRLALNDRQLRSLARDLARAARERGLELEPRRYRWPIRWPQRWRLFGDGAL